MPELVKIRSELFPRLYDAFLHDDDPLSSEQDWRNVFDYRWEHGEDHTGYALIDGDKVIGMMAMAFRTRQIGGRSRKFCNLHTWWVHEDHRGRSIAMLKPLLSLKDYTITHFTPCDRIRALTRRLGFEDLDLQMRVLLPLEWFGRARTDQALRLDFDGDIVPDMLCPTDRAIHRDHQPYRVNALHITDGEAGCYILYTCVERYRVRYCHIQHFGNRSVYARNEAAVRAALMDRHGVRFVVIDERRAKGLALPRSFRFWAPAHAVYRPTDGITPDQVDCLYSDVVMLRLAIMPNVTYELRRMLGNIWPGTYRQAS